MEINMVKIDKNYMLSKKKTKESLERYTIIADYFKENLDRINANEQWLKHIRNELVKNWLDNPFCNRVKCINLLNKFKDVFPTHYKI